MSSETAVKRSTRARSQRVVSRLRVFFCRGPGINGEEEGRKKGGGEDDGGGERFRERRVAFRADASTRRSLTPRASQTQHRPAIGGSNALRLPSFGFSTEVYSGGTPNWLTYDVSAVGGTPPFSIFTTR